MIDWEGTRLAYNRDYKTNYKTRKEFLEALYSKMSSHKISQIIYISAPLILKALKDDGIKILPKGHRQPSKAIKAILAINTKNKTRTEIAKEVGITKQYCWYLINKLNLSYKKLAKI